MKRFIYFIGFLILLVSCSINKKPIFVKVDDIKLISVESDTLKLGAKAYFKNPNNIGGKIATDAIDVLVNGTPLAKVSSEEFKVPANKDFQIPLQVEIPVKRVFENNKNNILGGLLTSLLNQKLKVQFKGDLKYKVLGISKTYTINKTEEVKIKL